MFIVITGRLRVADFWSIHQNLVKTSMYFFKLHQGYIYILYLLDLQTYWILFLCLCQKIQEENPTVKLNFKYLYPVCYLFIRLSKLHWLSPSQGWRKLHLSWLNQTHTCREPKTLTFYFIIGTMKGHVCACVCAVSACTYLHDAYAWWLHGSEETVRLPRTGIKSGCKPTCGCWQLNSDPLKEQVCLTTELGEKFLVTRSFIVIDVSFHTLIVLFAHNEQNV